MLIKLVFCVRVRHGLVIKQVSGGVGRFFYYKAKLYVMYALDKYKNEFEARIF